jgi:hypothetical protein
MSNVNAELIERLEAKDAMLFGLSDTLDAKASIALVIITFLATQSGMFLATVGLPEQLRVLQIISAFALAIAGGVSVAALWPRDHEAETPEALDEWLDELRAFYSDSPDVETAVAVAFRDGRIKRLKESIAANGKIDRLKSRFVMTAYGFSVVALALNMTTLLGLAFP